MAKVVLFISMSLDGYLADKEGRIDWLSDVEMKEEDHMYKDFYRDVQTVVLGRTTYDQITTQLAVGEYPYSNVDTYVITRENRENFDKIIFTSQSVVELVKDKKEETEGVLWIVGGSTLIQPLINENLIDEYQIAIIPTLLGDGIRLFQTFDNRIQLRLIGSHVINDMTYLMYTKKA